MTASGGPFRGRSRHGARGRLRAAGARPSDVGDGGKDHDRSATLMNKGLELIEAHHLFGAPYDRIDVVVHPQSIIHSLIGLCDGATLAHLGYPDMRVPISYALHYPERVDVPVAALDLVGGGPAHLRGRGRGRHSRACDWPGRPPGRGGTAPCHAERRQRGRRSRLSAAAGSLPGHREP